MKKTNLERNKPHALNDRIVQFFEDRPHFYDICLLSRKLPVPAGNRTDFSSCAPLKTHSDHEILLLMVFPFSGGILLNLHRKHADSVIFNLLRRSFSMRLVAPIET